MKVELSERKARIALSCIRYLKDRCAGGMVPSEYLKDADQDLRRALERVLDDVDSVEGALENALSDDGDYLYIYVPSGVRDKNLEEAFKELIPAKDGRGRDNFFWSNKFNNFVVRREFGEEIEEAVRRCYNGRKSVEKDPDWAHKEGTWEVVDGDADDAERYSTFIRR